MGNLTPLWETNSAEFSLKFKIAPLLLADWTENKFAGELWGKLIMCSLTRFELTYYLLNGNR